jgi:uncharacterized membrane protein
MAERVTHSRFIGPLPPPEILQEYNKAIPDGALALLRMAQDQQAHRIEREKTVIDEEQRQSGRGQIFGFIISTLGLLISGFLAYEGHDAFAGILGTTTIIGLVSVFVLGKRAQEKDLKEKQQGE